MKKVWMLLLCLLASGVSMASVIDGRINTEFNYPQIIPEVKKLVTSSETVTLPAPLTIRTTGGFETKLLEQTLMRKGIAFQYVPQNAFLNFVLSTENVPENLEAYTIDITHKGITVKARTDTGLFYGLHTLRWILRNTRGKVLQEARIVDAPDLAMRGIFLEINFMPRTLVERLCHAFEIYAGLKYNTLLIDFGDNFPIKGNPYSLRKTEPLTVADIRKIQAAASRNKLEIIPMVQVVSHTRWMMSHPDWSKMSEGTPRNTWCSAYCVGKEQPKRLVMEYLEQMTDILKPKYIHLGLDEEYLCPFERCPDCKGKALELFIEHTKAVMDLLFSKGTTPIIFDDAFNTTNVLDSPVKQALLAYDRRVNVNIWDYAPIPRDNTNQHFEDNGFGVSYMSWSDRLENTMSLPRLAARKGGWGCILAWWCFGSPWMDFLPEKSVNAYAATVYAASEHWNVSQRSPFLRSYDPIFELRRLANEDYGKEVLNSEAKSLSLHSALNARLGKNPNFPLMTPKILVEMKQALKGRQEHFSLVTNDFEYLAALVAGEEYPGVETKEITIPVAGKVSMLSFLNMTTVYNEYLTKKVKLNVAKMTVVYVNGKKQEMILKNEVDTALWNSETSGIHTRFVYRGLDAQNRKFGLFATDWRNPMPQEPVKSVVFTVTSEKTAICFALLGVSVFGEEYLPQNYPPVQQLLQKIPAYSFSSSVPSEPMWELTEGLPKGVETGATSYNKFDGKVTFTVENTPEGRMLCCSLPKLKSQFSRGRLCLDVPIHNKNLRTVYFKRRISNPEISIYASVYFINLNKDQFTCTGCMNYDGNSMATDECCEFAIPREAFVEKEFGGADFSRKLYLRISFFVRNTQKPMKIYLGELSSSEKLMPCVLRK